jgi:hypothetical protein
MVCMPEPNSPQLEAELQRLREMAEQLKGALAVLKKQIDASTPSPSAQQPPDAAAPQPRIVQPPT